LLLSVMREVKSSSGFAMDYIHYNPVKHGYVLKPSDYKWSSFNIHVKMGNYAANWGTDTISEAVHAMNLE
jgi:hypothetical protein